MYNPADWCDGCAHADANGLLRMLPESWKDGDPIPEDAIVHYTIMGGRKFYMTHKLDRIYLEVINNA